LNFKRKNYKGIEMKKFKEKLELEYENKGLFPFLAKQSKGENTKIESIKIKPLHLISLKYILEQPNTDIEKHYIKELLNLIMQHELEKILPFFKNEVVDSEENIILTRNVKKYDFAKTFLCPVDEDVCISRNKLFVDDYGLLIADYNAIDLDLYGDTNVSSFIMIGVRK